MSRRRLRFGAAIVVAAVASSEVVGAWALSPSPSLRGINSRRSSNCRRLHSLPDSEEICAQQPLQTYWTLPRLYVGSRRDMPNNLSLAPGAIIPLSPDQTHYLTNVMRIFKKRKGRRKDGTCDAIDTRESVRIFNGKDGEWLAKVSAPSDHRDESPDKSKRKKRTKQGKDASLIAECIQQLQTQGSSDDDRPWVLFAPLKKQPRMKTMIEKSTELGVGRLIPVVSDRTEGGALTALLGSKISDAQMDAVYGGSAGADNDGFEKLEAQAIEAAEQCERLGVPMITKDLPWNKQEGATESLWKVDEVVKQWCRDSDTPDGRALLICRERGSDRVVPVLQALRDNPRAAFLVGPEGGWSVEEEAVFDELCSAYSSSSSDAPVRGVSLGSTVLRAETACMLAVGAWALMNDS
ncbi:hypothetical protein ACHAXT_002517 [Thalassiosira profunda]